MKKKCTLLLLVITILLCFGGCSKKKEENKTLDLNEITMQEEGIRGKLSANLYENSYFNINFDLPEGFSMRTEEELEPQNEQMDGQGFVEMIAYSSVGTNAYVGIITSVGDNISLEEFGESEYDDLIYNDNEDAKLISKGIGEFQGKEAFVVQYTFKLEGYDIIREINMIKKDDNVLVIYCGAIKENEEEMKKLKNAFH